MYHFFAYLCLKIQIQLRKPQKCPNASLQTDCKNDGLFIECHWFVCVQGVGLRRTKSQVNWSDQKVERHAVVVGTTSGSKASVTLQRCPLLVKRIECGAQVWDDAHTLPGIFYLINFNLYCAHKVENVFASEQSVRGRNINLSNWWTSSDFSITVQNSQICEMFGYTTLGREIWLLGYLPW